MPIFNEIPTHFYKCNDGTLSDHDRQGACNYHRGLSGEIVNIGYHQLYTDYLYSLSRTASTMIVGPAGFNSRRNQKANEAANKKLNTLIEFYEKGTNRIYKNTEIYPERLDSMPIKSGESDTLIKLKDKLRKLEANHAMMKAANKIIRKGTNVVPQLVELGFSEESAKEIIKPNFAGRKGYASFELTNNNASIKRIKGRIIAEEREIERRSNNNDETINYDYGVIEEDAEINRLKIIFPDKPSYEVRQLLKKNGFRWSPRNTAWQRQLTNNARYAAEEVMKSINSSGISGIDSNNDSLGLVALGLAAWYVFK